MSVFEIAFGLLALAVLASTFVPRLKMPFEVVLLLGSLILGFVPHVPKLTLDSHLVFFLFLPPILFAAAYFTSWRDFKNNLRPISLLAIGLVLFTTFMVAFVMRLLIPAMSWPVAIVLGAMISPPDASAATSITRKLGIPRRLVTIIEGESLVNDATALVLYRLAVAAAASGSMLFSTALSRFVWMGAGGVAVGFAIGFAGIALNKRMIDNSAQILISFLTAFAAYGVGEHFSVSGVIATVTAGLYFGRRLPEFAEPEIRLESKGDWDLVLFVINGFVFTLMGLQLSTVLENLTEYSWKSLALYATVLSVLVVVVRFVWVFPATYIPRWIIPGLRRRDPTPKWQPVVVLSYTAMRGIVSLAASLALPEVLPSGAAFPYRDLLIFLTYTTILTTLLIPAFTLPWLLRVLGIEAGDENYRENVAARKVTAQAVIDAMPALAQKHPRVRPFIEQLRDRYNRRVQTFESNLAKQPFSQLFDEDMHIRRVLRETIDVERRALIGLRSRGGIHDEVFHEINRELDLEELRLKTDRI
jgi:CPA1 family monovalent cation:H+ antiporter